MRRPITRESQTRESQVRANDGQAFRRAALRLLLGAAGSLALALATSGCSGISSPRAGDFDSATHLRQAYARGVGAERARELEVPFEIAPEIAEVVDQRLKAVGDRRRRAAHILDFVFRDLDLQYQLEPTRNASETYRQRSGNCLSLVNLFVGLGRRIRLDPFYVEVKDYQRWNHRRGMVLSQGHIVAGLFVDGELRTFDFLPYRPKSYRDFEPIDDLEAAAHYFNNLGAEALLDGDLETAARHLEVAAAIDPSFVEAANNLGVLRARQGRREEAVEILRRALEIEPDEVPLLTNLARVFQEQGRPQEARGLLARVESVEHGNPFFHVYQGDVALAADEHAEALRHYRDALRLDTEIPEVHLGLVRAYVALGEVPKARHHLDRALRLDPRHPDALRLAHLLADVPG